MSLTHFRWSAPKLLGVAVLGATALLMPAPPGASSPSENRGAAVGAVYTLTNSVAGNAVAVFDRRADGSLVPAGTFLTGGQGTGAGLGSQGALVMSDDREWLFAVNAGSDDVSVLAIDRNRLTLVDRIASGGDLPISLTAHENLLYVLNGGGTGSITGFSVSEDGKLSPLPGSTRPLSSSASGPAQVQFSPDGDVLVVTEKATSQIITYTVDDDGLPAGPVAHPSAGQTPFGFAFDKRGHLIVSEAFGGAPGQSAASSYAVSPQGHVQLVSGSIPTGQTAACWVVVTRNGRYAYTANAGSGSVTGYGIGRDGSLSRLAADGRSGVTGAGSAPIDMAVSHNSRYLYALNSGSRSVAAFRVRADGSLIPAGSSSGLLAGMVGLAAW
jgi:6-phosphogluconolactonase